ncbi:MAG: ThaI family type II restriction endonuclease, partial [Promethearchaeota archaeon]
MAEIECSRDGKIGMEVGSTREKILIALLIKYFGESRVITTIPITEPETDVIVDSTPISIKTITGKGGVKVSWTVDAPSAEAFS